MFALISPQENNRICQVEETDFPVAEPLFWTECPDNMTTEWTYVNGEFVEPIPTPEEPVYTPTKEELLSKLLEIQSQLQQL